MADAAVLVLGAGLSGLHTAWRLRQAGLEVRIVEARDRIGGRILSVPGESGGTHRFDLGPAWYWVDFNPRMQAWVERLGLATYAQHADGIGLYEEQNGTLHRLSGGMPQQPESRRIVGGMASLVEGIAAQLEGVTIELGVRAVQLAPVEGGIEVRLADAGEERLVSVRHVVSTLPPRLLAPLLEGQPDFPPECIAALNAAPTWMAGQAKFVATYARAFWREAGLSGDAFSQRGPMGEIHDAGDAAGGHAALFGFLGVPPRQRAQLGEAALRGYALAQLQRLFGEAAAHPAETWLYDWSTDPQTATPADHAPVSQHPVPPAVPLPEAWSDRLFLAGTEFAGDLGGYLEGALQAADAAADALQTQRCV